MTAKSDRYVPVAFCINCLLKTDDIFRAGMHNDIIAGRYRDIFLNAQCTDNLVGQRVFTFHYEYIFRQVGLYRIGQVRGVGIRYDHTQTGAGGIRLELCSNAEGGLPVVIVHMPKPSHAGIFPAWVLA